MISQLRQRYGFALCFIALGAFKLWVIHTEEIYGSSTEYDALWYVGSAKHWYWFTPYSWTAFVRPCAYPLFIAVVHFFGIPLRIAIEFVQMAGYGVLIAALRKAAMPRWLCLVLFALMILHPASFLYNNHTMSESFYTALLVLTLGGLLLTLFTKKLGHAVWTGAASAVLWNTREESFLIPPILLVFFVLALWQLREAATRKAHFIFWLKRAGAVSATLLLLVIAAYSANYFTFHSFAKSELSSPPFENTLKALLRIKPSQSPRYVTVSMEALGLAYEASPAFARLKPYLEAPEGQAWTKPFVDAFGRHEFGPWFTWALRNVTANAGYFKDPVSTNNFYRTIAREINQACDEGRIPSRFVVSGFLDPGAVARIHYVRGAIPRIASLFLFRHRKVMVRADADLVPWMDSLYQEMVFRAPQPRIDEESNKVMVPNTMSSRLAVAVQNLLGAYYVYLVMVLAWAGLAAFVFLIFFHRRWRFSDPVIATAFLLGTTIATRLVFFAFLDATWWPGGYERYLVPVMPLTSCFFVLLIYEAIVVWPKRAT
jgi:hypothetical protein